MAQPAIVDKIWETEMRP